MRPVHGALVDLTEDLADLRVERESMMTDTCTITRAGIPDPDAVPDPETGLYPVPADDTVYTGGCSINVPGTVSASRSRQSAGDEAVMLTAILSVPALAPLVKIGDVITFTSSTYSPRLVGQKWKVGGLIPGSRQTAQKVSVEVVVD